MRQREGARGASWRKGLNRLAEQLGGQTWGAGICKQGLQGPCGLGWGTKEARMEQGQGSAPFTVLLPVPEGRAGEGGPAQPGTSPPGQGHGAGAEERRERGQAASRSDWRRDGQGGTERC